MGDLVLGDRLDSDVDALAPLILIDSTSHVGVYENTTGRATNVELARDVAASTETNGYAFAVDLADRRRRRPRRDRGHAAGPGRPRQPNGSRVDGGDGVIRFEPPGRRPRQLLSRDRERGPRWRLRHRRHGPRSRLERDLDPLERDAAGVDVARDASLPEPSAEAGRRRGRHGERSIRRGSWISTAMVGSTAISRTMLGNWGGGTSAPLAESPRGDAMPARSGCLRETPQPPPPADPAALVPGVALAGDCGPGLPPCDEPHEGAGCLQPQCCELVCENDVFCCETQWDQTCADLAADLCVDVRCPRRVTASRCGTPPVASTRTAANSSSSTIRSADSGRGTSSASKGPSSGAAARRDARSSPVRTRSTRWNRVSIESTTAVRRMDRVRSTTTLACGDVVFGVDDVDPAGRRRLRPRPRSGKRSRPPFVRSSRDASRLVVGDCDGPLRRDRTRGGAVRRSGLVELRRAVGSVAPRGRNGHRRPRDAKWPACDEIDPDDPPDEDEEPEPRVYGLRYLLGVSCRVVRRRSRRRRGRRRVRPRPALRGGAPVPGPAGRSRRGRRGRGSDLGLLRPLGRLLSASFPDRGWIAGRRGSQWGGESHESDLVRHRRRGRLLDHGDGQSIEFVFDSSASSATTGLDSRSRSPARSSATTTPGQPGGDADPTGALRGQREQPDRLRPHDRGGR